MRKRKNIINLTLFIILFLATIYILVQNKNSSSTVQPNDFAIDDTASIRKIFIADMKGESVILTKSKNNWLVNDEFAINQSRIELLLDVVKRLEVKNPTPENARNNVITEMAAGAIKVEFYKRSKKAFKVLYIGGPTQNNLGTYMALENKDKEPYVVHLPGFNGYLSEGYFFTDVNEWRTKEVFNYKATAIREIGVEYLGDGDSSFKLRVISPNEFKLVQLSTNEEIDLNEQKAKAFVQGFSKLHFLAIDTDISDFRKDSILNNKPIITIYVRNLQNQKKTLNLYYRPTDIRTRVELFPGVDKEYFLATASDREEDLVIMQRLVLDRIMWKTEDFKIEK